MLRKLLLCISFLSFALCTNIKAQDEDTLSTDNEEHHWKWDWDWEDEIWRWERGKPSIEFTYGISQLKHKDFETDFAKSGLAEIKLGYVSIDNNESCDNIFKFKEHYTFVSRMANSLQSEKVKLNEYDTEFLRFGIGKRSGYGYDFGALRILPYNENSAVWSRLKINNYPDVIILASFPNKMAEEKEVLDRFKDEFRFGTIAEGGVRVELGRTLSFNAGYETTVIFPRYMFWKHLLSFAIESAGLNALDNFVDEVFDNSPYATPVVNFLLKNGFSYAFYTLKKDKMNWPFNTETPLTCESFKFGVTFTF